MAADAPVQPNQWLCFRGRLERQSAEALRVRIACDSKYWLWVNGRLVVFEGGLRRGPSPSGTYVDEIDLSPHLSPGTNIIAVLVWYWGKDGFSHQDSGRPGLLFDPLPGEASGDVPVIDWRTRLHPAFGDTAAPYPNFRLPEPNVQFDARRDIPGWIQDGYDDSNWAEPVRWGVPPIEPWGELVPRPIPQWRDSGLRDYVNAPDLPRAGGDQPVVARLPYNAHVTAYLKVRAPAGRTIDLRSDSYDNFPNGPSVRSTYITREGEQEFESFGWFSGHEVHYTIPADVEIIALKYRETGYDADFEGFFTCDDPALNELWKRARRTLYVTMRDTYMDCPDRERAQWWGDVVNELGEAFYALDPVRGPLLARKGIHELVAWQKPDGALYSPIPAGIPDLPSKGRTLVRDGTWDRELPMQMLASVGWYGFWTYYWYSGDEATLRAAYPAMRRYLSLWDFDSTGLVEHRAGGWDWPDWGKNADVAVLENAWYYLALKAAAATAPLAGAEADVAGYRTRMSAIEKAFGPAFWDGEAYRSDQSMARPDDRANALAVVAGLVPRTNYEAIAEVLRRSFFASPYMEKYVLEALFKMGKPDQALQRMSARYRRMLDDPITTLWENFGGGEDRAGRGTYNHAWSGGPLTLLSQYVAGVTPTGSGWTGVAIKPQMGELRRVVATVPTPQGVIGVTLVREDSRFTAEVDLPSGVSGHFTLPLFRHDTPWSTIVVNGANLEFEGEALPLELNLAPGVSRIEAVWQSSNLQGQW